LISFKWSQSSDFQGEKNTFIPKSAGFCNQVLNTFNFSKKSNLLNFIFRMMNFLMQPLFHFTHTHTHTKYIRQYKFH